MAKTDSPVTAETLKIDHPSVYEAIFEAGAAAAVSESDQIINDKDAKIMELTNAVEQATSDNKALANRIVSLENKDSQRAKQEIANTASVIIDAKIGASAFPADSHVKMASKVAKIVNHTDFIVEGTFDSKAFSAAVDAEISDWEASMLKSPVDGVSFNSDRDDSVNSAETDAIVARLLAH